VAPLFA